MGAWIETHKAFQGQSQEKVAPCVGAWIETKIIPLLGGVSIPSRPVWARGLKLRVIRRQEAIIRSRPVWARGLKRPIRHRPDRASNVAPCVGAWIETALTNSTSASSTSRALCGRVD